MQNRFTTNILLLAPLLLLMSCQPGAPVVTVLGEVGGFEISESTQILKSKTSKSIFYISGKCQGSIKDILISFDNGSNYTPLSQFAESYTLDCSSNGTYSYKINPNSTIAFDIPADASYRDFKLRGISDFGNTLVLNLRRMVTNGGDLQITAGSVVANATTASGTPVVLRARVLSSAEATTGPGFKFKGAIRVK